MNNSDLVEIGAHTCHHYRLQRSLDPVVIESEIINSRQQLQDELKQPAGLFYYSNGDVCLEAF